MEHAGIGRYVTNLINQIESQKLDDEYLILLRKKYFKSLEFQNEHLKKILVDYPHYSIKEQIFLPVILFKLKPNLVHFLHFNLPFFYFGKYVVTIHDLIKHTSRGIETTTRQPWLYWIKYLGYKIIFWKAVNGAKIIIVPSETVKEELTGTYKLPANRVIVAYEGVDKKFKIPLHQPADKFLISNEVLNKYRIKRPFVIYVGSVYPHKNIERLIRAIKVIDKPRITLIISCSRSIFLERIERKIQELEAENFVISAGFIPDEDLVYLYSQAEAFVWPTLSEGFGLPGLEAMSAGCPVICSDIPVLREIYEEATVYFNPLNIQDIAEKIKEVVNYKPTERRVLVEKGNELVKRYSWEKMARKTLDIYKKSP